MAVDRRHGLGGYHADQDGAGGLRAWAVNGVYEVGAIVTGFGGHEFSCGGRGWTETQAGSVAKTDAEGGPLVKLRMSTMFCIGPPGAPYAALMTRPSFSSSQALMFAPCVVPA